MFFETISKQCWTSKYITGTRGSGKAKDLTEDNEKHSRRAYETDPDEKQNCCRTSSVGQLVNISEQDCTHTPTKFSFISMPFRCTSKSARPKRFEYYDEMRAIMSYVGSSSTAAADDDYNCHGTAHVVVIGVLLAMTSLAFFPQRFVVDGGSGREKAREKHGASS